MAKGIMYIDGQRVPFDGETNVLSVIRKAGIEMPTFCYYSDLSVYGACRMCVVEDERGKIETSCSMKPRDGLSIRTNTARLLKHRRMILELLLASHNCSCTTCEKSGDCRLQELAMRFGVRRVRFGDSREESQLEGHKRYADIQYLLEGSECVGYAQNGTVPVTVPYDPQKDIGFWNGDWDTLKLEAGMFYIVWPDDLHAPRVACGAPAPVKRMVVKVKLDP